MSKNLTVLIKYCGRGDERKYSAAGAVGQEKELTKIGSHLRLPKHYWELRAPSNAEPMATIIRTNHSNLLHLIIMTKT